MIEAVREYDPRTAAGILSGLALRLGRPSREKVFAADPTRPIEEHILAELRRALKLEPKDESDEAVERLADALDEEAARIAGVEPGPTVTDQLSRDGLLPSDVFEIRFDPQLETEHRSHWHLERTLTERTIRRPHREQNLAPERSTSGVSIFARYFTHKFPARSFWMLVAGLREASVLHIGQVFRIYRSDVDLSDCESLIDVLKAFATRFGLEVEVNGQTGTFFSFVEAPGPINHNIKLPPAFKGRAVISSLNQALGNEGSFQLVFAINLTSYFQSVEAKHGWDSNIMELLK